MPDVTVEPPTPAAPEPIRPFKDYDEEDDAPPHEIIEQQQLMMNGSYRTPAQRLTITDQDERLTLLSHSINRQSHLSVQIGDELDIHHELLEDTDAAMDRTAARLNSARRRLDHVADNAKQYGGWGRFSEQADPCREHHYNYRAHFRAVAPHHCVQDVVAASTSGATPMMTYLGCML